MYKKCWVSHCANPSRTRCSIPPVPSSVPSLPQTNCSVDVVGTWSSNMQPKRRAKETVSILDAHATFQVSTGRGMFLIGVSESHFHLWEATRLVSLSIYPSIRPVSSDPIDPKVSGLNRDFFLLPLWFGISRGLLLSSPIGWVRLDRFFLSIGGG